MFLCFIVHQVVPRTSPACYFVNVLELFSHVPCMQALPPKPFPKLSVKLLDDVAPDGPVHLVAVHCHNIVKQRGLKRVDFSNPGRRKEVPRCSAVDREPIRWFGCVLLDKVSTGPSSPVQQ